MIKYVGLSVFEMKPYAAVSVVGDLAHGCFEVQMVGWETFHDSVDVCL